MTKLLEKEEQMRQAHAGLIHRVVIATQNPSAVPDLDRLLKEAQDNGWTDLVATIRKILKGSRETSLLRGLDEEDQVIVSSILNGIQNPATLPQLDAPIDGAMAAPGLAAILHGARTGDHEALQLIGTMANQMMQAGGDMARLAAVIRPLVLGERDPNKLCEGMSDKGQTLVNNILAELRKLETH
jgi:hypothetical protein